MIEFLVAAALFSLVWGIALRYADKHYDMLRRWSFFVMGFTRLGAGETKALTLSAIYYALGLLGMALLLWCWRPVSAPGGTAPGVAFVVLGVVGEISLAHWLTDLGTRVANKRGVEWFAQIEQIPWIEGLRQLPATAVPIAAALGGVVEEIFYRGVVLRILHTRFGVAAWTAIAIAGALFCFEQLIQLRTTFQMLVIGLSSAAISIVGGLLVVESGAVWPAVVCHAAFVIFYVRRT